MKILQKYLLGLLCLFAVAGTYSCQQACCDKTGSEFVPDMAHSVAYEANVNTQYDLNSWDAESVASRYELSQPRQPVKGTVPRGYSAVGVSDGVFASAAEAVSYTMSRTKDHGGISYTPNGSVPYYYPNTEEGRALATQQLLYNPFPITKGGIARGQELYNIYCGICHGDKGDGSGYLVRDNGGKYPAQPANFLLDDFVNSSNGRFYHGIVYGKNAMGSYADKLSYEERWQVIHYIRMMQAKEKKLIYNSEQNTLNPEFGVPEAQVVVHAEVAVPEAAEEADPAHDAEDQGHEGGH